METGDIKVRCALLQKEKKAFRFQCQHAGGQVGCHLTKAAAFCLFVPTSLLHSLK